MPEPSFATTYIGKGETFPTYLSYGMRWSGDPIVDSYLQGQFPINMGKITSLGIEYRSYGNFYLDPTSYSQMSIDPMYELVRSEKTDLRFYLGPIIVKTANASFGLAGHVGLVSSFHLFAHLWIDPALEIWTDAQDYSVSLYLPFRFSTDAFFVEAGTKIDYFINPNAITSQNNWGYSYTGLFYFGLFL